MIIIMLIGILASIAAVIIFLFVRRISGYQFLGFGIEELHNHLGALLALTEEALGKTIKVSYVDAVKQNNILNRTKSRTINIGASIFVAGVVILLISLKMQLNAFMTGAIPSPR